MIRPTTNGIITGGIVMLFFTMGFVIFISLRQSERVRDTARMVNTTQETIRHAQELVMTALDNETGARGYVITGKESFLEPLYRSVVQIDQELKWMFANNYVRTAYPQVLDSLQYYINKRIAYSNEMTRIRRDYGLDSSIALVNSGRGKAFTDQIRHLGLSMIQSESLALDQRKLKNEKTMDSLNRIFFAVLGLVFILGVYSLYNLRMDIRKKDMNERKFRALLDSAPDATVIVDDHGVIRMVNQQTERLFGYMKDDLLGKKVEVLIPEKMRHLHESHRRSYTQAPRVRMMGAGIELQAVKKDGSYFPVAISLSPIQTEEGLMVSASVRDISLSKELENNLRKTNEELEAFTYSVSHDLRAPLRGITGFTTILETDYGTHLDAEARRITGVIKANALRMGNLIDDLLAFSRMGRKELIKVRVDMEKLVEETIAEQEVLHKQSGIHWEVDFLPMILADPATTRQVWINLISNAIKYSSKSERPKIRIGHFNDGKQQVYFVQDNGVGFDNRYKDKLFKVFQRLHSHAEFEGTGVGLALVHKIISRHGGQTWAEGEVGKGATFYFSFPKED